MLAQINPSPLILSFALKGRRDAAILPFKTSICRALVRVCDSSRYSAPSPLEEAGWGEGSMGDGGLAVFEFSLDRLHQSGQLVD